MINNGGSGIFNKLFYGLRIISFFPLFPRWLALFLSLKAAYRLHHRRLFGLDGEAQEVAAGSRGETGSKCLSRQDLILWLDRPTNFPNAHTSPVVQVRRKKTQ